MPRYSGKYTKKRTLPLISWLMLLLVLVSLSTGTVVAYLAASSKELTNRFEPAPQQDPKILETFENNTKENVRVRAGDTGYPVYVRAAIVVTWKNGNNILPQTPVPGTDYELTLGEKWTQRGDGYYYYAEAVPSGETTDPLVTTCTPLKAAPENGYSLSVDILTQTVQALGTTDDGTESAVQDAWGTTP